MVSFNKFESPYFCIHTSTFQFMTVTSCAIQFTVSKPVWILFEKNAQISNPVVRTKKKNKSRFNIITSSHIAIQHFDISPIRNSVW